MTDILIRGGTIVTMNSRREIIKDGSIAITGNNIEAVGKTSDVMREHGNADKEIDAKGKYVFPGLVDTHTHLFQSLLKGLGDDKALQDWWLQMTAPAAVELTQEDCYAAAMLGCIEAVKSGTTCVLDYMYVHPRPRLSDSVVKAFNELGIRGIFARGFDDAGVEFGAPEEIMEDPENVFKDCRRLVKTYGKTTPILIAPNMIWTTSEKTLREIRAVADELGIGITMHISETTFERQFSQKKYQMDDLEAAEQAGLLGPDFLAVHCVWLDAKDLRILKIYDAKVSHNPVSNMYLASGTPPIPEMVMAGITVGLAVDGAASNNNQDMIETMKFASLLHKVNTRDPTVITAEKVLEMATIDGARAVGLEKEIGSLEVGKKADLFIADFKSARAIPVHHPVSTLVYAANGEDVETTIIDGKVVVENRHVMTVDEEKMLKQAKGTADSLVERAGIGRLKERPWRSLAFK